MAADGDGLQLHGDLTVQTARRWFARLPKFAPGGGDAGAGIRVDLSQVAEVDSAGLALLVHLANSASAAGCSLAFAAAPPQLLQMAKISGVESLFAF